MADSRGVALTFDDGPSPLTAALLDVLASREVRATFFLLGQAVEAHSGDVAAIRRAGHVIGNHTYDHPHPRGRTEEWLAGQLQRTNDAIIAAGGEAPTLYRPPYGERSDALDRAAASLGLAPVLWDIEPQDWTDPGAEAIIERVVPAAEPGSVILLHDRYQGTVDALPVIIDRLRTRGLTFVTVPTRQGSRR